MTPSAASFCRILNGGRRHRPDRHRRRQWRGRSGSAGCLWRGCWLRAPHPRGRHRGSADIGGGQDKLTERNVAGFAAGGHGGHFLVTGGREPSLALENPSQIALGPSSSRSAAGLLAEQGRGPGPEPGLESATGDQGFRGYDRGSAGLTRPLVLRAGSNGVDGQDEVDGSRGTGPSAPDPVSSRSPRVNGMRPAKPRKRRGLNRARRKTAPAMRRWSVRRNCRWYRRRGKRADNRPLWRRRSPRG